MKFLAVFVCALAFASAGVITPVHYEDQHVPVIGPNGVPVDTPAVQQATADHLAYKAEAHARNGDYEYTDVDATTGVETFAPIHHVAAATHVTPVHHKVSAEYTTPVHHGVVGTHHTPVHHQGAYTTFHHQTHVTPAKYNHVASTHVAPVHHQVAAAHVAPFQHHQVATSHVTPVHHQVAPVHHQVAPVHHQNVVEAHIGQVHHPVTTAHGTTVQHHAVHPEAYTTTVGDATVSDNGTPLETPEVVAAKHVHFAAHGKALAQTSYAEAYTTPYTYGDHEYHTIAKRGIYTPVFYTTPFTHTYTHSHYY